MGRPNPSGLLLAEYIGQVERTQGTETSKYLVEKKESSISEVAASEMEIAQTIGFGRWGCGARLSRIVS